MASAGRILRRDGREIKSRGWRSGRTAGRASTREGTHSRIKAVQTPHSPPANHTIISSGWQKPRLFHIWASWNHLPDSPFKDVRVILTFFFFFSLQRPQLPAENRGIQDGDGALKMKRSVPRSKCLSDTFQPGFRCCCWPHVRRICFKSAHVIHAVLSLKLR